ncbi:hypothetical protein GCM10018782_43330 [Streptomyces griseoaurantiacus]|nr:hypothetical protein GCM10018782_43330 [Streptomyces griseoaurantiacus]
MHAATTVTRRTRDIATSENLPPGRRTEESRARAGWETGRSPARGHVPGTRRGRAQGSRPATERTHAAPAPPAHGTHSGASAEAPRGAERIFFPEPCHTPPGCPVSSA